MSYRQARNPGDAVKVLPDASKAASDGTYKLVRMNRKTYTIDLTDPVNSTYTGTNTNTDELYRIDMTPPNPVIDKDGSELASGASPLDVSGLDAQARQAYATLRTELDQRDKVADYHQNYDSTHCPGDGNRDLVVDQKDLDNWRELSQLNGGQSSWYDLNHDGKTDAADRAVIEAHIGKRCTPPAF